jgi:hypothetical protein
VGSSGSATCRLGLNMQRRHTHGNVHDGEMLPKPHTVHKHKSLPCGALVDL